MSSAIYSEKNNNGFSFLYIIKTGLLAGMLDISFAFLYSYIKRGTSPSTVLQYISKTVFRSTTFNSTAIATVTGLLVHFGIAMAWSFLFFSLYNKLRLIRQNKIITGTVYGLVVWTVMNMIVLPVWNSKPFVFNPESSTINAVILILAIGLPLSLMASRYYKKRSIA